MIYWPHQESAHAQCRQLFASGVKSWCLAAPCGAGKSKMMQRIAIPAAAKGLRVALYCHRVMLTNQMIEGFASVGADFGVMASGFERFAKPESNIQICSLDTIYARLGNFRHEFPKADLVIVDEAHQQTATKAQEVFGRHDSEGAKRIGFTATPVDIGGMYDRLVLAGTYGQMLDCNAHLPIVCYGPDRPDTSALKAQKGGDFSSTDDRRVNAVPTIIGRVYDYWKRLNPEELPAIGFAPGVGESRWFVEEFKRRGIPCAHIDAERVVLVEKNANGVLESKDYVTDESSRKALLEGSKSGLYRIVWNRFVLREAIDMPWLYHAICATSMGSLSTYLQSIGRVQRYWPYYDHVILQDHGGNIDRHGTPDIDRDWTLGCTNNSMHQLEVKKREAAKGEEAEPICCPQCCAYRLSGPVCHECGYMHKRSVRIVRQLDGDLVRKAGRVVKHKAPKAYDDYLRSAIYAGHFKGMTVKQAHYVARARARKDGIEITRTSLYEPAVGSGDWDRSCREIYPNFKPKQLGASHG